MVAPLTALTRNGIDWRQPGIWTKQCEAAFHTVKRHLTEAPVLATPDFTKTFEVVCDAIGAVLLQDDRPIAFQSMKLNCGVSENYIRVGIPGTLLQSAISCQPPQA
jgi:hypothetical protein